MITMLRCVILICGYVSTFAHALWSGEFAVIPFACVGVVIMLLSIHYQIKHRYLHERLVAVNYIWLSLYMIAVGNINTYAWSCHVIVLGLHIGDFIWKLIIR